MQKRTQDRITSFSVKPTDLLAYAEIAKLREHSAKTGISFSHLMVQAITKLNEELGL